MRLLYIENRRYRFFSIPTKHQRLSWSLLLCILLHSCTAIEDMTYRAQLKKAKNQKDTTTVDVSAYNQVSPIKGKVISPFGYRGGRQHTGSDIKLHKGDTVRAAYCGRVTKASCYFGYGNLVILKHLNGLETYYAHLSKCLVNVGDSVVAGEIIGLGGRTGSATTEHLHFEVRQNRVPRNPEKYFDFSNCTVKIPFLAFSPVVKTAVETPGKTMEDVSESVVSEDIVTIKKGDTLYSIARRQGTTVKKLQNLNGIGNTFLSIGMNLKVK
jgi:murein DD-endopeptidase MepM/ murein hydrolase activator NlpD